MILCTMRTGKKVNSKVADNRGVSLVELIVVVAIMSIIVGISSYGLGLMFTRDANYVAVRIDDQLGEARTLSMSKGGVYICELHIDDSDPYTGSGITIYSTTDETLPKASWTKEKEVPLDKKVSINVSDGGSLSVSSGDVRFIFDKAKGNVKSVNGDSGAGKAYSITVTSRRNTSKFKTVTLVGNTGRHYTDK